METIVNIVGSVALLLWGIRMMRTGVTRSFGAELRRVLSLSAKNRVTGFLTGLAVPERILNMANEALSTPRGKALRGLLGGFECVDNTLKQHRSQFLRRCSKGLLFLRRKPEPRRNRVTSLDWPPHASVSVSA